MQKSENSNKIYFEHFDFIRFIAAFMIIILHAYDAWLGWFEATKLLEIESANDYFSFGNFIHQFIKNFGIGVDVFFLLSGFLITYILIIEKEKFGKIHIGKFMIRRAFRIWPLYFILICIAPFLVQLLDVESPNYLANLFFVGNFEIIQTESWTFPFAHFWSICIEEHFYLVWPFIIYFVPNKRLLIAFLFIISFSIGFRMFAFNTIESPWYTLFLHTFSKIDILVIGAIGAVYYARKPFIIKLSKFFRILLWIVLIGSLSLEPISMWDSMLMAGIKNYFYLSIIVILLLDYNFNPYFKHLLPKKSIFHYFGKISYGIYMYGNILLLIVIKKIMWKFQITNMWLFFLIVIVLSIVIPIISYELFEKQILKLNKRFRVIKTDR